VRRTDHACFSVISISFQGIEMTSFDMATSFSPPEDMSIDEFDTWLFIWTVKLSSTQDLITGLDALYGVRTRPFPLRIELEINAVSRLMN
jgi:hypothetical protein